MKVIATEGFKPISHGSPDGFFGSLKFYGRMLLDFHVLTVFKDVRKIIPLYSGRILDVGCGGSPYRFLLDKKNSIYTGIDVVEAESFDYESVGVIPFDGENIPFEDEYFDGVICTEVLEHVFNYQKLVDDVFRVSKKGSVSVFTIPFSARYHYIPYDYFRYTPSALEKIFSEFSQVSITPRGNEFVSIAAKIVVLFSRNIIPASSMDFLFLPVWIALLPVLAAFVMLAHASIILNLGSSHDPLGYTIKAVK